jgi:hypothetical protein
MTSSTSSSSSRLALAVAALACAAAVRAGGPAAAPGPERRGLATRIALLPLANLSGHPAPLRELQAALESALRVRGLEVASGGAVDAFLARHRLRYTGGVDGVMGRAAREDLGADALLVGAVTLRSTEGSQGFAMSMRLVSARDAPAILWMDETARTLDDAPGLFDLGVLKSPKELMDRAVSRLADSLAAALAGKGPAIGTCPSAGRFAPRVRYRAAPTHATPPLVVAVMPFVNETGRIDAGELLALELVRELSRSGSVRVLEPGVVRAELLRNRVVMEGGVSHETARIALGALEADVVVAGYVRTYDEVPVPRLEFTVLALATWDNRVLWESTSHNRGDDRVVFFDWGRVSTTPGLACRMVRPVAEGMVAAWAAGGNGPATPAAKGSAGVPGNEGAGPNGR